MLNFTGPVRFFVAQGATDMRRSFDFLAGMVSDVLKRDPFSGHVVVFFNRRRDRVKMLFWDRGGFWLLYRRLEEGTFGPAEGEIDGRRLFLLLEGIEVIRERRRYERKEEKREKESD